MRFLVVSILVSLCSVVYGELDFENANLTRSIEPGVKQLAVEYPFENKQDVDVVIEGYEASCGCIKTEIHPVEFGDKKPIPPGGKGFVRATFSVGNFSGTVKKSIGINYKAADGKLVPQKRLNLEVSIPVLFDIKPKTMTWLIGEGAKPKTFKIKVNHDQPIRILSTTSTNANYQVDIKTVTKGWEYEIVVTPKEETPGFGILRFNTDCAIPGYEKFQSFMVMKRSQQKTS